MNNFICGEQRLSNIVGGDTCLGLLVAYIMNRDDSLFSGEYYDGLYFRSLKFKHVCIGVYIDDSWECDSLNEYNHEVVKHLEANAVDSYDYIELETECNQVFDVLIYKVKDPVTHGMTLSDKTEIFFNVKETLERLNASFKEKHGVSYEDSRPIHNLTNEQLKIRMEKSERDLDSFVKQYSFEKYISDTHKQLNWGRYVYIDSDRQIAFTHNSGKIFNIAADDVNDDLMLMKSHRHLEQLIGF